MFWFWCSAAAASAALAVAGHHPVRAHLPQLLPVSPAVLHLVQVAICPPAGHLGLLLHAALDPSTTGSSCLLTSRARAAPALNSSRLSVCAGAITSTSPIVYLLTSRPRLCPAASLSLLQQLFLLLSHSQSPCSKSPRCTPSNFHRLPLLPSSTPTMFC